jgi:hypothetical protein
MRSQAFPHFDYIQDNAPSRVETLAVDYRRISEVADEAARLPGNKNDTDFEEFILRYRLTRSSFA